MGLVFGAKVRVNISSSCVLHHPGHASRGLLWCAVNGKIEVQAMNFDRFYGLANRRRTGHPIFWVCSSKSALCRGRGIDVRAARRATGERGDEGPEVACHYERFGS